MIALVVGHRESSKGVSHFGMYEWDIMKEFCEEVMKWEERKNVKLYFRPDNPNGLKELVEQLNKDGADYIIEMHCNSVSDSEVFGNEVLYYYNSKRGREIADDIQTIMSAIIGNRNRPNKPVVYGDRGGYLCQKTKGVAVIVEPFFLSNLLDTRNFLNKKEALAKALAKYMYMKLS